MDFRRQQEYKKDCTLRAVRDLIYSTTSWSDENLVELSRILYDAYDRDVKDLTFYVSFKDLTPDIKRDRIRSTIKMFLATLTQVAAVMSKRSDLEKLLERLNSGFSQAASMLVILLNSSWPLLWNGPPLFDAEAFSEMIDAEMSSALTLATTYPIRESYAPDVLVEGYATDALARVDLKEVKQEVLEAVLREDPDPF